MFFLMDCWWIEEKSRVRSQGWHEHIHTWYNIRMLKRCGVYREGKYMFSIPWSGAVLGWGGSSWTPLPRRLHLHTSPRYHLSPWYWLPQSCRPHHSILRSFLPPRDGHHHRCRCFRRGVCKNLLSFCLGVGEAFSWTAATLPTAKWWKYEGLELNCQWC